MQHTEKIKKKLNVQTMGITKWFDAVFHPLCIVDPLTGHLWFNQTMKTYLQIKRVPDDAQTMHAFLERLNLPKYKEVLDHLITHAEVGISKSLDLGIFVIHFRTVVMADQTLYLVGSLGDHAMSIAGDGMQDSRLISSEALLRINQSLMNFENINELLDYILYEVYLAFNQMHCGCILLNEKGMLRMTSQIGYTKEAQEAFELPLSDTYIWRYGKGRFDKVYRINQIELITEEDYSKTADAITGDVMVSSISAPIVIDGVLYALINFDSPDINAFTPEQEQMMEFVRAQLAIAIKNMQLLEKTRYLTRHDALTGCWSRHYFEERLHDLILDHHRHETPFSLVVMDADHLKVINDTYGHLAGDELIITLGRAFTKICVNQDMIARFGGDEFIGYLASMDKRQITQRLNQLRTSLDDIGLKFEVGFSFGVMSYPEDGHSYVELLRKADQAMYEDKLKRSLKRKEAQK